MAAAQLTWLLEVMIERAGFSVEEAEHSEDGIFARYRLRATATGESRLAGVGQGAKASPGRKPE